MSNPKARMWCRVWGCAVGWAEKNIFRNLITLGEILLIHRKKGRLSKFQLHWTFFRQGTPRLKITKITKIIKFSYFLTFFSTLTKHETKTRTQTIDTNIYELIQRSFATNVKQVAILCGFAWRKFSALQTAQEVSALTEFSG